MTAADRTAQLAWETAERIGRVAPAGLGLWPRTWQRVAEADAAADAALRAVEAAPEAEVHLRLSDARGATTVLVQAWRSAALAWCGAGCPREA